MGAFGPPQKLEPEHELALFLLYFSRNSVAQNSSFDSSKTRFSNENKCFSLEILLFHAFGRATRWKKNIFTLTDKRMTRFMMTLDNAERLVWKSIENSIVSLWFIKLEGPCWLHFCFIFGLRSLLGTDLYQKR